MVWFSSEYSVIVVYRVWIATAYYDLIVIVFGLGVGGGA